MTMGLHEPQQQPVYGVPRVGHRVVSTVVAGVVVVVVVAAAAVSLRIPPD